VLGQVDAVELLDDVFELVRDELLDFVERRDVYGGDELPLRVARQPRRRVRRGGASEGRS
jgi:hypothetical protein